MHLLNFVLINWSIKEFSSLAMTKKKLQEVQKYARASPETRLKVSTSPPAIKPSPREETGESERQGDVEVSVDEHFASNREVPPEF